MSRFVHTYRRPDRVVSSFISTMSIPGLGEGEIYLKTYELQDDGSLVERHEPKRMFACQGYKTTAIDPPDVMENLTFRFDVPYYEVMPSGNYRRIHDDELAELRKQDKS